MYLTKLELHGFKSFANRTDVRFDPGVTAIVGPNGCGKSNIIDAVRWVLGEHRARLLRSDKMENVIFNGSGGKKPLGLAEVSLTIENTRNLLPTQYSEVRVTRRLYRSGDSEYLLNNSICRRKDIVDLFMDTGLGPDAYSVIELKMIEDILSDNAMDRRRMFEEAAGITKYKVRRAQTFRKLNVTRQDLDRVRDHQEVLSKQVASLKRQARKAARFRELSDTLQSLELQMTQIEFERLSKEKTSIETERSTLQEQIQGLTSEQSGEEASVEKLRKTLVDRETVLGDRQRKLNEHVDELRRIEADRRVALERIESAKRGIERIQREEETAKERTRVRKEEETRLTKEMETSKPALEEARKALEIADKAYEKAKAAAEDVRNRFRTAREEAREAEEAQRESQNVLSRLSNKIEFLAQEKERLAIDVEAIQGTAGGLNTRLEAAEAELTEATRVHTNARTDLSEAEKKDFYLRHQQDEVRDAIAGLARRFESVNSEIELLEGLVSSYEDFSEAVQFLAASGQWTAEAPTTVADVLTCKKEDQLAIRAALGDFASCFVVQSENEAANAIRLLAEHKKGRATFLVLDRLPDTSKMNFGSLPSEVQRASSVVTLPNDRYQPLADVLLGHAFIVESLDEAQILAKNQTGRPPWATFVTRSGEWANAAGISSGGATSSRDEEAHRIGRRERLSELHGTRTNIESDLAQTKSQLSDLFEQLNSLKIERLRELVSEAADKFANVDRAHAQVAAESGTLETSSSRLVARIEEIDVETTSANATIEKIKKESGGEIERIEQLTKERASLEEQSASADTAVGDAAAAHSEANVACVQAENTYSNLGKDLERLAEEAARLEQRSKEWGSEIEQLEAEEKAGQETVEGLKEAFESKLEANQALESEVKDAESLLMEVKSVLSEKDSSLRDMRRMREQILKEESTREARLAELKTRLEVLVEQTLLQHEINLGVDSIVVEDEFDFEGARKTVPDLRMRLRNIGAVNELALESYEEESAKLEILNEQVTDLENAEKSLLETIDEINTTASQRFGETIDTIQTNFTEVFAELFGEGAKGELKISDSKDPLEAEIDVIARPPGKRPSSVSQLSGGEKTLTAIALLFSIYLVKPSPFCILDEVDAPLDDANVRRFMKLIHRFSEGTQFILVTHNKLTMEAAHAMYGVTMAEKGISKLVGVKFDREPERLAS